MICFACSEETEAVEGRTECCGVRVGIPITVSACFDCGVQRFGSDGLALPDGTPCLVCGSLTRVEPRKAGEVKGMIT